MVLIFRYFFISTLLTSMSAIAQYGANCTVDTLEEMIQGLKHIDRALTKVPETIQQGQRVYSINKKLTGRVVDIIGDEVIVDMDNLGDSGEIIYYSAAPSGARSYVEYTGKKANTMTFPRSDLLGQVNFMILNNKQIPINKSLQFIDVKNGLKSAIEVQVKEAFSNGKTHVTRVHRSDWALPRNFTKDNSEVKLMITTKRLYLTKGSQRIQLLPGTIIKDNISTMISRVHSAYLDPLTNEEVVMLMIPNYGINQPRRLKELSLP